MVVIDFALIFSLTGIYSVGDLPAHVTTGHPYPNAPGVPLSNETQAIHRPISEAGVRQMISSLPPSAAQYVFDFNIHL